MNISLGAWTKSDLVRLARLKGGTVEEDTGYRDVRVFQVIAPNGRRWVDGVQCIQVERATGSTEDVHNFNRASWAQIVNRLTRGHEAIPADELEAYAEE
jgi:hypothetical protein